MKITIIGAGSSYTPELIEGLINNYQHLKFDQLVLYDVKLGEHKLHVIHDLTKRMFSKALINVDVIATFDKIQALKNANYIIIQLRVGGLDTRVIDETIPIKYNMLGQETNGFGGMFKALRTIPVILDLVDEIKKHADNNVWVINFSNPAGIVTEAVHSQKHFTQFVGVCNCAIHLEMVMAQYLNTEREQIRVDWVGLNHLVFGNNIRFNKRDVTKEIVSAFVNPEYADKFTMRNVPPIPYEPEYIKALNLIPCPYYRYFIKYDEMIKEEVMSVAQDNSRAQFVKQVEKNLFLKYEEPDLVSKPKELESRGGAFYSKVAIEVLVALAGGPEVIHAVNYPNNGNVLNFPKGQVLEISAHITKNKVTQMPNISALPKPLYGLITLVKNYELQVIQAAITGNYEDGLIAANISPFCRDDKLNKQIYDEMLNAHKQYLPLFFKNGA